MRARDMCVGSPTGSVKTLAFVLPVLNSLGGRRVRRGFGCFAGEGFG